MPHVKRLADPNKGDVLQVDPRQIEVVLAHVDENDNPLYEVCDSPPPPETNVEKFHRELTAGLIKLEKDGEICHCEEKQLETLLAAGWKKSDATESDDSDNDTDSGSGSGDEPNPLREKLLLLDPDTEGAWNNDGQVNMGYVKEHLDASLTRDEINAAWPWFTQETLKDAQTAE